MSEKALAGQDADIQITAINPPERSRIYTFTCGSKIELKGVSGLCIRPSGNHRIRTADGLLHVVAAGWLHIEINADGWSL